MGPVSEAHRPLGSRLRTESPAVAACEDCWRGPVGGREVVGVLKGYDALLNLVLDETKEFLKDPDDPYKLLDESRPMGLTVCRGTSVMLVCPTDGRVRVKHNSYTAEQAYRYIVVRICDYPTTNREKLGPLSVFLWQYVCCL